MKAKLIAAMLAMMLFCSFASAQDYCIRVDRRINLRDAASLESNVLETVATGTTRSVTGELNRWLRINRNGREVWMANWVSYSRLENCGGTGSPQGTPSGNTNIDNCCFVDRQCQTDQEWTAGYYAFQNNECQAPAGSGTPTSSQPISGASAQIDNCCFVDRQCTTDLEWMAGWHAYQNNQCGAHGQSQTVASSQPGGRGHPADRHRGCHWLPQRARHPAFHNAYYPARAPGSPFSGTIVANRIGNATTSRIGRRVMRPSRTVNARMPSMISIVGEPDFVNYIEQRLDLLRNRLPHRYDYVLRGLDRIELRPDGGGWFAMPLQRTFFANRVWDSEWDTYASAALVHEACHVHRIDAGHRVYHCDHEAETREEVVCQEMTLEVLIELDAPPHVMEFTRATLAEIRTGLPALERSRRSGC